MPMKNPPHPGGFVLRQCIEPLGLTITQAATALGVTRTTLSELVNGKRGISPEMAVRLSKVFGGSAATWLTQQAHYDLAQVRADRIKVRRLEIRIALWNFQNRQGTLKDMGPAFNRYIGIDYSGAKTPTSSLKGLRIYTAEHATTA